MNNCFEIIQDATEKELLTKYDIKIISNNNVKTVNISAKDNKTAKEKAHNLYGKENVKSVTKHKEQVLALHKVLEALDRKDRGFYDRLSAEEQKGFSAFLMLKYISCVSGNPDIENYYIASANYHANKHMLHPNITKHKKLQYLMLTTVSPGVGIMRHNWIPAKKAPKETTTGIRKELSEIYPTMKDIDLDMLAKTVSKQDMKDYRKACGDK